MTTKTIAQNLTDLGAPKGCRMWTLTNERGAHYLTPRGGAKIALATVLPAGAKITCDESSGIIEYSPKGTGYARLAAGLDFERPSGVLVDLIDSGASIEIPS